MERISIREMLSGDLGQVHAIENICHATPWSYSSLKYELENPDAILIVAVIRDQIAGFACARTILDMTHLLNIAVLPEFRHRGIGTTLLRHVLERLEQTRPGTPLTLEVRKSNVPAIRLYERFGFKITGMRKGYYQMPDDDGLLMQLSLK